MQRCWSGTTSVFLRPAILLHLPTDPTATTDPQNNVGLRPTKQCIFLHLEPPPTPHGPQAPCLHQQGRPEAWVRKLGSVLHFSFLCYFFSSHENFYSFSQTRTLTLLHILSLSHTFSYIFFLSLPGAWGLGPAPLPLAALM